jgi:hypothetical protein
MKVYSIQYDLDMACEARVRVFRGLLGRYVARFASKFRQKHDHNHSLM